MSKIKVIQIGGNTQKNGITTYLLNTYERMHIEFQFIFINTAFRESDIEVKRAIESLGGKIYHLPYGGNFEDIESEYLSIIKKEMPDAVHAHYFFSNGDFLRVAENALVPIRISHCHNDRSNYLNNNERMILLRSRELCEAHATLKLAVSENAGKFLYGDYDFKVSRMVINTRNFHKIKNTSYLHNKHGLNKDISYSIFVGRFSFQKNVFFFIELLKQFKDRKLIMIGEGPEKDRFVTELKNESLDNLVVFKKDTYINELLNIADTFLLPSLYEGASISLIEAQFSGLDCVASNRMSKDSNLGNVTYLKLDPDLWVSEIEKNSKSSQANLNTNSIHPDNTVNEYRNYYTDFGRLSEHYIVLAKEFKLGSYRVYNDWKKVVYYFSRAHDLGDPKGTFYYALQYFEGLGIKKDIEKAEELLSNVIVYIEQEAGKQVPEYTLILGDIYSFGLGRKKSLEKAFKCYQLASHKGINEAMCSLAYMYEVGAGTIKNREKAFELYKKSAENGYLHSMRDIGLCYLQGIGTDISYVKAMEWLEKASQQNYAHATTDLAYCYLEGKGVTKNSIKAIKLFKKALIQDEARTKRDLISHSISIDELLNEGIIVKVNKNRLMTPSDIDNNVLVGNTVVINKHIEKINPNIFYNHKYLNKFFVEKDNPYYFSYGGVLYSKDLKTLIRFPLGANIETFDIPEHVEIISSSAFDDCVHLRSITMQNHLKEIHSWAFHGCDKLEHIEVPASVRVIGEYAFGSCETLKSIKVNKDNQHFKDIVGNLFTKDGKVLLQYAIGKHEKLYVVPNSTNCIEFRAFSDAMSLEYIDLKQVHVIKEKAFNWCKNLQKVIMHPNCQLESDNIFKKTSKDLEITYNNIKRMIMVSDIHGHLRLDFIKKKLHSLQVSKEDVVVILGDAGIVWENKFKPAVKSFYSNLPCEVYFIDGNHENFDILHSLETVKKNGDYVHKVMDNVFHLIRGNAYIICGNKILAFGGAYSIKRDTESSPVRVWKEELPQHEDYHNAEKTINENHQIFDYIFTHQAPKKILNQINYPYSTQEHKLLNFLDGLSKRLEYSQWFFGHIHMDLSLGKFKALYNESVVIRYDE